MAKKLIVALFAYCCCQTVVATEAEREHLLNLYYGVEAGHVSAANQHNNFVDQTTLNSGGLTNSVQVEIVRPNALSDNFVDDNQSPLNDQNQSDFGLFITTEF